MTINKSKILRFLLFFLGIVLVFMVVLFCCKDYILHKIVDKAQHKFENKFDCNLNIKSANFEGLSTISIHEISLKPKIGDTLFSIQKVKANISILELFSGDIILDDLEIQNGFVQLIKNKGKSNFEMFLKSDNSDENTSEKQDYADKFYSLITRLTNLIPEKMKLTNVSLLFSDNGKKVAFKTDNLRLKNHQIAAKINVKTNTFEQNWVIGGMANPREQMADITIQNSDTTNIQMPYIDQKWNLKSSFSNLNLKIDKIDMSFGELAINGKVSVDKFTLNNPRIAKKDIVFDKAFFDYKFLIGSNFISIDSSSTVQINDILVKPFAEYNTEKDTLYKLKIKIPSIKAQDFINSLPKGLFSHFEGMKATGDFDYSLNFKFNKNHPSGLIFDSKLNRKELRITQYGAANLDKLNTNFTYKAIENGKEQRPIMLSSENPFYSTLDKISPFLQKCVLTSEDPSFMSHRGFIKEAFKQSILKNIRTKKFARGASTISMQLVKNVFLTREKTLSRKLEEILLVYILENNRIASKERMLEVYFNVIEWGPNVYGIGEATAFYFQKKPIDLTLKECLFLASIVPKPKKFMYQFDNEGNLKSFANKNHDFIKRLMLRRGLLVTEDTIGQNVPLLVSGYARSLLKIKLKDTIAVDSVFVSDY